MHVLKGRRFGKNLDHAADAVADQTGDAGAGADHHSQQQYSIELKHNPEKKHLDTVITLKIIAIEQLLSFNPFLFPSV